MKYSYGCTVPAYGDKAWTKHNIEVGEQDLIRFFASVGIDPEYGSVAERFTILSLLAEALLLGRLVSQSIIPKEDTVETSTKLRAEVGRIKSAVS